MFKALPGFRDFYPEDYRRRDFLFQQWKRWSRRFDFEAYDIPTLESLDLLKEKSGDEIVGQLFHFEDQGGREVALRPEITTSLARMIGAKMNSLQRPVKWFAIAENFRYERQQKGRLRSHYQWNADLFGEAGEQADAEIIALLLETLRGFGLGPEAVVLRLSDRVLWSLYLESLGFEGDRALEVLGIIDKMERLSGEAVREQLQPYFHDAVEDFLAAVEGLRLQRDIEGLGQFLRSLVHRGDLVGRIDERLGQWERLLASLASHGVADFVRVDAGIVRGLAYYTGFVFEVFALDEAGELSGRALAGGGRFDQLVERLGYGSLPAVGFGMGDVVLMDTLEERGLLPPLVEAPDVFCIVGGVAERGHALRDAAQLRRSGLRVRYPLKEAGFGKQFKLADRSGARLALIYGSEEVAAGQVRLRDLSTGSEKSIEPALLLPTIQAWLENPDLFNPSAGA